MLNGSGHAYSKKRPDYDERFEDISQAFSVLRRSVSSGCGTESLRFKSEARRMMTIYEVSFSRLIWGKRACRKSLHVIYIYIHALCSHDCLTNKFNLIRAKAAPVTVSRTSIVRAKSCILGVIFVLYSIST